MWSFNIYQDNVAIITEVGEKITYKSLQETGDKLAANISNRCLVFCLCGNETGSLLGYTTFLNHRIVPLMLDAKLDRELLTSLIATYRPDYLWVPDSSRNEYTNCSHVCEFFGYSLLKTEYNYAYPLYDELALLLTTSGSTGSPKLVRQSYVNIKANTKSIVSYLELNEKERVITTLPMNYTYGLSILNTHMYVGASIILTAKTLMQKEFWQQFKDYEATSFSGVPYVYEMLNRLKFFKMNLPSLRTMTQAGGKLSLELHKKFGGYAEANGIHFVVMYGQTEATARMSYLPYEKASEKYGSMGIAIPGGKFVIVDTDSQTIQEPEVVGELVYEGANVTLGYAECGEDLAKGDERHGVLVTGDMAKRDADGFYYIVGRKKRFLKIFGNRVNLDETERLIKTKHEGMDCACAGVDDAMYLFITDEAKANEVKNFISEKTGLNHSAFKVKYLEVIPRNESGKTLYLELEEYYA